MDADASPAIALQRFSPSQLRLHRVVADRRHVLPTSLEDLAEAWHSSDDDLWVDLRVDGDMQSLRELLDTLSVHPLIREDCLGTHRSSRFSSYERSLHFEVPLLDDGDDERYLSVLCVPRLLITIRSHDVGGLDAMMRDWEEIQLHVGRKSALLHTIQDALLGRLIRAAHDARGQIHRISRQLDEAPASVDVHEILSTKRRVQAITTVAEDQLYSVGSLVSVDTVAFPMSGQRDYWRDANRSYEALLRVLQRYEMRAADIHQQYVAALQTKTESRLRVLTILSAICMPLTLIAGIYGMNFVAMPETQVRWGYPATLGIMLAIALGQLWYFARHGWFK